MQLPKGLLRRLVAGALYAALSVQLLYDLNPQIEISLGRLLLVTLIYAIYGCLLFGLALWVIRLIRKKYVPPSEVRPHGFGFIVLAAVYCALVFWFHRLTLEVYLPLEAVRNLSRAAPILGFLTIALLALWIVERTAIGWQRQFLFVAGLLLILVAIVILSVQRSSLRTEQPISVPAPQISAQPRIMVVTIGYLPHDWVVRMDAEGVSAFFSSLRDGGFFARVQPFPTRSRRAIWASLLTGKLPYRHGVAGGYVWSVPWEDEPFLILPNGLGVPQWGLPRATMTELASVSGNARPVWDLLESSGARVDVVSQYGVEPEIVPTPLGERVTQRLQTRGSAGAEALKDLSVDVALIERCGRSAGVCFAHLGGLDRVQVLLRSGNDLPDPEVDEGAVYREYVAALGDALELVRSTNPDTLIMIVSPSAVRPNYTPQDPISFARAQLRPESGEADGFIAATGPGVASVPPSLVLTELPDLVPTILWAAGLPVGRDMDGGVMLEMFEEKKTRGRPLELIPSWEAVTRSSARAEVAE